MNLKIYKLTNFFQNIIVKNMFFFISLGIFKILSLKWNICSDIIDILIKYIIPVAIAYTTGNIIEKKYGAIASVLATTIFLVQNDSSDILTIIFLSSISSGIIKSMKKKIVLKYFSEFEMIIFNIFLPLVIVLSSFILGDIYRTFNIYLQIFFKTLLKFSEKIIFIFFITPIIEISKVFFLNNLVNHGFLFFLGYEDLLTKGKSIFFLLETNPGPGLGVLLAYFITKKERKGILSSIVLEFIGGIHEFYFPYVLKNIKLLIPLIISALISNLIFYFFDVALYTLPSPGSFLVILLFAKSKISILILGILLSTFISFIISLYILKDEFQEEEKISLNKKIWNREVKKIGVVCTGGMGTSVIGKNYLLLEIKKQDLKIEVENYNLLDLDSDVDIILTHKNLEKKVQELYPDKKIITVKNYLDKNFYKSILEDYVRYHKGYSMENKKIQVELNQKRLNISDEEQKKFFILRKRIGVIENESEENKITIKHYPYGVKHKEEEVVVLIILSLIKEKRDKIKEILTNLEERVIEDIELSDTEEEIIQLFKLESLED